MADPDVRADRGAVQPDVVDLHLHTGETEPSLFHVNQDGGMGILAFYYVNLSRDVIGVTKIANQFPPVSTGMADLVSDLLF